MLSGAGYQNPHRTGGGLRVAMVAPYPDSPAAASKGGVLQSTY